MSDVTKFKHSFPLQRRADVTNVVHKHEHKQDNVSSYSEIADKAEKYKDASISAVDDNTYESIDDHETVAEKVKPVEMFGKNSDPSESRLSDDELSHKYLQGYECINTDGLLPTLKSATSSKDDRVKPVDISSKSTDSSESRSSGEVDNLSHKYFQGYEFINADVLLPNWKKAGSLKRDDTAHKGTSCPVDETGYLVLLTNETMTETLPFPSSHALNESSEDDSSVGHIQHSYLGLEDMNVDVKRCSTNGPEIVKILNQKALRKSVSSNAELGPYYAQISPVTSSCSSEGSSLRSEVTGRKSILLDDQETQLGLTVVRDRDIFTAHRSE